uniref:NTP-PPase-like protein n=1 Tax=Podoviridae sp. ctnCN2 TaxID=2825274 RepID=A0A8S5PKU2_9CAUD|nr:MAG TPA: NTP-PPase-like protein [Podoviridae sp. ctnCN2]
MMGYDLHAALEVVNASNWSKFEDGQPVFDEQGKIQKGKNYRAPSLEAFA